MKEGLLKRDFNATSDVFYIGKNLVTRLHDNGKIAKLLNLNYVACLNLLKEADTNTVYQYVINGTRIIVADFSKNCEFILLSSESVFFYSKMGVAGNFKPMTLERYNRIKDLCTDLVNKFKV